MLLIGVSWATAVLILSHLIVPRPAFVYLIVPYRILSYLVLPFCTLSGLIVPCPAYLYLIVLYRALSHLIVPWRVEARAILEDERTGLRRDDSSTPDGTTLVKSSAQHHRGDGTGTLTPELAARVSGVLLPSVVNLLDALVTSPKLERVMEEHQAVVCRCMAQAVAQVQSAKLYSEVSIFTVVCKVVADRFCRAVVFRGCVS